MARTVETRGGQIIQLDDDDNWIGCAGVFGEDDLLDIIEATRGRYTEEDEDDEEE